MAIETKRKAVNIRLKRKCLSLILLLCFWSGLAVLPAWADTVEKPALEGTGELLDNGGFEENDGTTPTSGWIQSSYWGTKAFIDTPTDAAYENAGSACAKIVETGDDSPHISCWVYDVVPGAEYQLSTWMKVSAESTKKGAGFKMEFRTAEDEASTEGTVAAENVLDTGGAWVKKVWQFTAPYDTVRMKVYMRLYVPGTVWFDNVSLVRTTDSLYPPFTFLTDSVFYYTDRTDDCRAAITLNDRMLSLEGITFPEGAEAVFALSDDGGAVKKTAAAAVTDGTAEFLFSPALLAKEKDYTVSVSMTDSEGKTHTAQQVISLYDRPTALSQSGTYYKVAVEAQSDGTYSYTRTDEVFHPVIGYHVGDITAENLAVIKSLGINVVQLSLTSSTKTLKERLDTVQAAGMMALVCLYNKVDNEMQPAAHPDNVENTKKLMQTVTYKHPAVFAYAMIDEPSSNLPVKDRDALLRDSYKLVRSIDPHRPTYLCDFLSLADVQRYSDVFCMDRYQVYDYGKNVSIIQEASLGKKPVYTLMRCHNLEDDVPVTMPLLRYMFYDGLIAGAKGVGFYAWEDHIENNEELKTGIMEMHSGGELDAAYAHFVRGSAPTSGVTASGVKWSLSADKKHLVFLNTAKFSRTLSVPEDIGLAWAYFKMKEPYGADTAEAEHWYSASVQIPAQSTRVFSLDILADGAAPVFLNEADEVVTALPSFGTVTVRSANVGGNSTLYVGLYKRCNGICELIEFFRVQEDGVLLSCTIEIPPDGGYELHTFLWEDNTLRALTGVRQLI